jgi:hypothetical protein
VTLRRTAVTHFGFNAHLEQALLLAPGVDDMALIDVASASEFHASWADVDVTLAVEDEVVPTESPSGAR